jgi:hypothetical protein
MASAKRQKRRTMGGKAMRDPLTEPRPGDVVIKLAGKKLRAARRWVLRIDDKSVLYRNYKTGYTSKVALKSWREWCRGAEVIRTAEGGV